MSDINDNQGRGRPRTLEEERALDERKRLDFTIGLPIAIAILALLVISLLVRFDII